MVKYILKRIGYTLVTLFTLSALTFFMMRALPGDPFIGEKSVPDAVKANLNAKYGLDKSVGEQFVIYVGNVLHADFGTSITYNRDVSTIISEGFVYS